MLIKDPINRIKIDSLGQQMTQLLLGDLERKQAEFEEEEKKHLETQVTLNAQLEKLQKDLEDTRKSVHEKDKIIADFQ